MYIKPLTTTTNLLETCTITTEIATSRYGSPRPQIMLRTPKGTHFRQLRTALLTLAAEAELATPASERWCVNTEDESESGRVYLELGDATPAAAARGMAMLTKLVGLAPDLRD